MSVHENNNIILRDNLMQLMDSLSQKRIIYVYAPAGYGKTISISQWMKQRNGIQTLISLDEYDNDLGNFCRKLCSALITCQPNNAVIRDMFYHPFFETAPDEFTIKAISAIPGDLQGYLAIDDLHTIHSGEIRRFLSVLIERLPKKFLVLILSRNEPPPEFSVFLLKNALALINAEQLRFTKNEIILLFRKHNKYISQKQAQEIFSFTEGWAIGLNALLLSGKEPSGQRLVMNHLETFIKTQVWERWDESTRNFMVKTSIMEELTPSLCIALTNEPESEEILTKLVRENAFLSRSGDNTYRFHQLFRKVLLHHLYEQGEESVQQLIKIAGNWYLEHGEFYKAIELFVKSNDSDSIAKCFEVLDFSNASVFLIDKLLPIIRLSVDEYTVKRYPVLLLLQTWAAFNEGHAKDMEHYANRVYEQHLHIVGEDTEFAMYVLFLRCFDYRSSMHELEQEIRKTSVRLNIKVGVGTITQNMILFHRSSRDFSEYAVDDMEKDIGQLKYTIGELFGHEQDLFENCLLAGLKYEQGNIIEAYHYALSANTGIDSSFTPESKLCAMMIMVSILDAQQLFDQAQNVVTQAMDMIEREKAYYLNYNLKAYVSKRKLWNGDMSAAEKWLGEHGTNPYDNITFYKLYGHFTTARAYITQGYYDTAIIILTKIVKLCKTYRRPLDVIEGQVLLSIAYWKKKRGFQNEAIKYLEQAIILANQYDYIQVFVNEGSELTNMLYRIQKRVMRQDYDGEIPGNYTKRIYLQTLQQAKYVKGMTNGQTPKPIKFTDKQKIVMKFLCEGCSYRQIAEHMGIKFSTVRSHIELIYKKLDVPNETAAIMKIEELGILNED